MERVVVSVCNGSGFNHRFVTAEAVMVGIGFMVVHTLTLANFRNHVLVGKNGTSNGIGAQRQTPDSIGHRRPRCSDLRGSYRFSSPRVGTV